MDINELVRETNAMMKNQKLLEIAIKDNRSKIQQHFDETNVKDNFIIVDDIKVTKVQSAYITYNGIKLEKKLRKNNKREFIDQIIRKTYTVINIKAFTDLIKLTGISPFELRTHLDITRNVDGPTIKNLFEKGDLTTEDLEDCFESRLVNSVRFTEIKQPEGD